jgi:biotin transport system substrate-specific component
MQRTGALTLSQAVVPQSTFLTSLLLVLAGSVTIAIGAQISIPWWPVPFTAQTFAVLLVGTVLGSRLGALAVIVYLAEGLAGLPVFAGGNSAWVPNRFGEPYITGPTAGFLVGFVIAAFVVGLLAERRGMDRDVLSAAALLLVGNLVLYIPGLAWLQFWLTSHGLDTSVWQAGLLQFIPGDVIKLIAAALVVPAAWRVVPRLSNSPDDGR